MGQVVPHWPQLSGSAWRSAQMPPQGPLGDSHTQAPWMQASPGAQAWPHAPQLPGSASMLRQEPEQSSNSRHPPERHRLWRHTSLGPQAVAQSPQ